MNALNTALTQPQTHSKESMLSLPSQLKAQYPLSATLVQQILKHRQTIQNILSGQDHRLMVITGPCSIHDPIAVLEYADRLQQLQEQVKDQIFLVKRAYIEKPRTTVGWKGFLYDPNLDGSSDLQLGLEKSRELYIQLIEKGLPSASEILSPMATGYFDDLLAWVEENRPRVAELEGGDEVLEQLRADLVQVKADLTKVAGEITKARTKAAAAFSAQVTGELESLAMPGATVQFKLSPANPGPSGADLIELGLISRPDSPWIPMSKGASGGELSRIMLAVEVVLAAADPTETFVFDEVDAGVGGAAAVEVGKRLARLARNAQVIVVTHLPQVAAFADRHLVIARSDGQEVHSSSVSEVQQGERVAELSRMLAGLADSQAGTQLAEELLALAQVERKAK